DKTTAVTEEKAKECGEGPSYVVLTFDGGTYIENGKGGFPADHLVTPYQEHVALPADATFTGFSSGSRQLWISASNPDVVYLVDGSTAARVPRGDFRWGCA